MKNKKWLVGGVVAGAFASVAAMYKATSEFGKDMLYRNEIERTDLDELDVEEMQIKNEEGMVLYGYLVQHNHADRTLIMLHELKENASSLIECAKHFEKMLPETNIVLLDLESHGMSDGYLRSFGEKDANNLILWNRFLLKKLGSNQKFIIYGKNLGANAMLHASALGQLQNVKVLVSDGACDRVSHYLTDLLFKKYKINSKFALPILRRVIKQESGLDIKKLNGVEDVKNNAIPTIFIHSKNEKNVNFKRVFDLYNNNASKASLFPVKEDHFYEMNQDDSYSNILKEFITKYI